MLSGDDLNDEKMKQFSVIDEESLMDVAKKN